MTQQRISIHIPRGHCRSCREAVVLADPELPAVAGNGRLQVKGLCPACGTSVTSFFKATPIEKLPPQGLDPAIVGLLATGIKQGFREAASLAKKQRADNMLAVQRELQPTLSAPGPSVRHFQGSSCGCPRRCPPAGQRETRNIKRRRRRRWNLKTNRAGPRPAGPTMPPEPRGHQEKAGNPPGWPG